MANSLPTSGHFLIGNMMISQFLFFLTFFWISIDYYRYLDFQIATAILIHTFCEVHIWYSYDSGRLFPPVFNVIASWGKRKSNEEWHAQDADVPEITREWLREAVNWVVSTRAVWNFVHSMSRNKSNWTPLTSPWNADRYQDMLFLLVPLDT